MTKPKEQFVVDKARVDRAIQVVVNAFGKEGVTQLEGGIAMRVLLDGLAKQGLDIQSGQAIDPDDMPVEFTGFTGGDVH